MKFLNLEALTFKRPNLTRFMSDTGLPRHKCGLSFSGPFVKLRNANVSFVMSVCPSVRPPARNDGASAGRNFVNLILEFFCFFFFENASRKFTFDESRNNNGYFTEQLCTVMIIFRSLLLEIRNVSDKRCRENQNTHFVFNNFFSRKLCLL